MAHIDLAGDEADIKVIHNTVLDKIIVRIGYDGTLTLKDRDEAHALIDQLQDALRDQAAHQGRQIIRDEDEIRSAATIREDL